MAPREQIDQLLKEVRGCRACAGRLPNEPRPIVQLGSGARLVIIGQAPGRRVHESGIPWADPSGDRLRSWLGIEPATFYDASRVALIPMGFCYPGSKASGDLAPRPECAPLWHDRLLAVLPADRLTVLIGAYAIARYVPGAGTLTAAAAAWRDFLPDRFVLPHPSPRNRNWLAKNAWFETEAVPVIRERVVELLGDR